MANSDLRMCLTHHQLIITTNQGCRFEINVPTPGNMVVVNVSHDVFHIGHTYQIGYNPHQPPRSPNLSDLETDSSRPPSIPPDGNSNPGNPPQN